MAASAFTAYFSVDGVADTEVENCFYELRRSVDEKGRPSSVTQGGIIRVEIVSTDGDAPMAEWMVNSYKDADGKLEFLDDKKATLKTVEFKKARCIGYSEKFDRTGLSGKPSMTLNLTISAEKISVSGAEHDNNWDDKR